MSPASMVILDACVLAPVMVCDLFLRLAEEPRLYSPRWSAALLDEVRRTHIGKLGWPVPLADHWRAEVEAAFPEALVSDYEHLVSECQNHADDRHVLAAARVAGASTIVTFNLVHFPPDALAPHAIAACHPADYLCLLHDTDASLVLSRLEGIATDRGIGLADVLRRLRTPLPRFATHVAQNLGWPV